MQPLYWVMQTWMQWTSVVWTRSTSISLVTGLWCLMLCVNMMLQRWPECWLNIISKSICGGVILDDISIWTGKPSKAEDPHQCGWASSNPSKAHTDKTGGRKGKFGHSLLELRLARCKVIVTVNASAYILCPSWVYPQTTFYLCLAPGSLVSPRELPLMPRELDLLHSVITRTVGLTHL